MSDFPQMPPNVAKALTQVMAGAKKLGKDEKNPFANYKYAGVEAFLEMLRPLCAEAGLQVLQDELSFEFHESADKSGKMTSWLVQTWAFGLGHQSGEVYPYQFKRTSMVQASMGSQSFGAGQSYALKSFLRSIGLIATGDSEDADSHEPRELPAIAKTKAKARADGDYETLTDAMRQCSTRAELTTFTQTYSDKIAELPDSWKKHLRDEYARIMEGLEV